MALTSILRKAVPPSLRTALLRNRLTYRAIRACVAERQRWPHPHSQFIFTFSGHRNLGWATGGLGEWEREYFQFCSELFEVIRPRVVWDIGANVGIWTLYFAASAPPVTAVVAFEPDRCNLHYLRANVEENNLSALVEVRDCALSSAAGEATFMSDPFTGATGSLEQSSAFITKYFDRMPEPVAVQTSTIDSELTNGCKSPDFLKIDVEGHEHDLFRGATHMLAERRPCMLVEFGGPKAADAVKLVSSQGYRLFDPTSRKECYEAAHELAVIPDEHVSMLKGLLRV
jgi:FkbM family methyltransferase